MHDARFWIQTLNLQRHPEGGWYAETYRSSERIPPGALPARYAGPRPWSTAIYFLLEGHDVSHFHRLASDEQWHFYAGSGVLLHLLPPDAPYVLHRLGSRPEQNERPLVPVPRETWMAAELDDKAGYALMGCTVAPGFDFAEFTLGERALLASLHPDRKSLIERLTLR